MTKKQLNPCMPAPCPDCPFRTDVVGYLRPGRAQEIAESLRQGRSFICHNTSSFDNDGNDVFTADNLHCAGAAIVLENEGMPNQLMQVAQRLGCYSPPTGREHVVETLDDWVAAMAL